MQFKNIIGHERLIEQLLKNINEKRVSHALLFNGPGGAGKLALALAFVQYLMCENRTDNDSCGACSPCIKNEKLVHPDLHFSFPFLRINDKTSCNDFIHLFRTSVLENFYLNLNDWNNIIEANDKQLIIPVKESNEIMHKLSLKSFESEFKISLIWNADKLRPDATTKLLKIIEEPPENTIFILITNNSENLLPTLVSRTQLLTVPRLSIDSIQNALITKEGFSENKARAIAQISNGSYRSAIELSVTEGSEDYVENFLDWMRKCFRAAKQPDKLIDWVEHLSDKGRENQKAFINMSLEVLRECMLINTCSQSLLKINDEDRNKLSAFAPFIHKNNAEKIMMELNKAYGHIERNAHAKILFLDLSMKIHQYLITKKEEVMV